MADQSTTVEIAEYMKRKMAFWAYASLQSTRSTEELVQFRFGNNSLLPENIVSTKAHKRLNAAATEALYGNIVLLKRGIQNNFECVGWM